MSDAAIFAPNVIFTEFTARKLSNPRFRGIGSSPGNPAVTTFLDGVPQLNSNSSSVELLDIEQIEFVRGPQSALFGRNTLGGLVNVTSRRPGAGKWTGQLSVPFGNFSSWDIRGNASGSAHRRHVERQRRVQLWRARGLHRQRRHGPRSRFARSVQRKRAAAVEAGAPVGSARDRQRRARARRRLRAQRPGGAAREPFPLRRATTRASPTATSSARPFSPSAPGRRMRLSTTTGFVKWKTEDSTDLDYSPLPLAHTQQRRRRLPVHAGGSSWPPPHRPSCRTRPRSSGRRESSCSRRATSRTR